MTSFLDTRNGLGENKQIQLQYESSKNVGMQNGIPIVVFFEKTPWIVEKTTYNYIGDINFWNDKVEEMKTSLLKWALSQKGVVTENVNMGERLIIDGEELYSGSYTLSDYKATIASFTYPANSYAFSTGSVSPSGYMSGDSTLSGHAIFSARKFSESATLNYLGPEPKYQLGDTATIDGVNGIVSAVNKTNPRYFKDEIVYDFTITVTSTLGSDINFT